jgi:hypothetical protein
LPKPQLPPNVILQLRLGIVNVPKSPTHPHNDVWGGMFSNPSSSANQWPIDPPPPIHVVSTNESFTSPSINPKLTIHIVATNKYIPPPPPPNDHKNTHGSQVDKGNKPITSTDMAKSSSSAQSNLKSTRSGKRILNDMHPEVAQLEEIKP